MFPSFMAQEYSGWQTNLLSATNSMAEQLGLDDLATTMLREFVLAQAKEQYKAGNRSGIRWARSQTEKATA